jgi:exopolysaccharide biosynthesis protein
MSQLSSTQLSTLANASLFSDSQIENMNDQLFEQQEARKQKLTNDMGDDQDNQDGSRKNEDNKQA